MASENRDRINKTIVGSKYADDDTYGYRIDD